MLLLMLMFKIKLTFILYNVVLPNRLWNKYNIAITYLENY